MLYKETGIGLMLRLQCATSVVDNTQETMHALQKKKTCLKYKKIDHFARVYNSKVVNFVEQLQGENSPSGELPGNSNSGEESGLYMYAVNQNDSKDEAYASINEQMKIDIKVDTGAQANLIPQHYLEMLSPKPTLQTTNHRLTSYCGSQIPSLGTSKLQCRYKNGHSKLQLFYVVASRTTPINELKSSQKLNLVKFILNTEAQIQTDQSTNAPIVMLSGDCEINLKHNVTPTVHPARKVPIAMRDKLKNELVCLEELGIIKKVIKSTEWANAKVMVEKKDGRECLCINPVNLDKAIKQPYYPIPTFYDAISNLDGAPYFSKLATWSRYWTLQLSQKASCLTTFSTICGCYHWKRYPLGLILVQDVLQQRMEQAFDSLKGLCVLIDDLLNYGRTQKEHDERLKEALQRARKLGIRFNKIKCQFGLDKISYFGHEISKDGIKPDPEKLQVINRMPEPKNEEELQTLLGMLNFLSRYIPKISSKNKSLRDLLNEESFLLQTNHLSASRISRNLLCLD
ncbi:hypothetical protein QYM36_007791 [Artemia franciscana]|uniref:Reverse transcriptase domain-containing protein n=1 Tax=Artemia franciscana TaxID=6661 RepID=A0AA88IHM5_ARTSF|nr:hypothetical protein QYM36_007791 [Artemia franciscana]